MIRVLFRRVISIFFLLFSLVSLCAQHDILCKLILIYWYVRKFKFLRFDLNCTLHPAGRFVNSSEIIAVQRFVQWNSQEVNKHTRRWPQRSIYMLPTSELWLSFFLEKVKTQRRLNVSNQASYQRKSLSSAGFQYSNGCGSWH